MGGRAQEWSFINRAACLVQVYTESLHRALPRFSAYRISGSEEGNLEDTDTTWVSQEHLNEEEMWSVLRAPM